MTKLKKAPKKTTEAPQEIDEQSLKEGVLLINDLVSMLKEFLKNIKIVSEYKTAIIAIVQENLNKYNVCLDGIMEFLREPELISKKVEEDIKSVIAKEDLSEDKKLTALIKIIKTANRKILAILNEYEAILYPPEEPKEVSLKDLMGNN